MKDDFKESIYPILTLYKILSNKRLTVSELKSIIIRLQKRFDGYSINRFKERLRNIARILAIFLFPLHFVLKARKTHAEVIIFEFSKNPKLLKKRKTFVINPTSKMLQP